MIKDIDWSSIEVDCWSRDFDYKEYLSYVSRAAAKQKATGEVVSEKEYNLLCQTCEKHYTEFMSRGFYD